MEGHDVWIYIDGVFNNYNRKRAFKKIKKYRNQYDNTKYEKIWPTYEMPMQNTQKMLKRYCVKK